MKKDCYDENLLYPLFPRTVTLQSVPSLLLTFTLEYQLNIAPAQQSRITVGHHRQYDQLQL